MSNLFTLKNSFFLLITIVLPFSLKAQNTTSAPQKDTSKLILIVTPGKKYAQPANTPAYTAPSTSERAGTASYSGPGTTTPIRTTTAGYTAPSTAERSGAPTYMNPTPVQKAPAAAIIPAATTNTTNIPVTTGTQPTTVGPVQSGTITPVATAPVTPPGTITPVITGQTKIKVDTAGTIKEISSPRTNKILFAEVGGPGLAITLNYDARFGSDRGGLGFRIGMGYFGDGGNTVFTVPFQLNYLIGHGSNFIEIGGGTTFLNSTGDNTGKTFIFDRVTGLIGTATIGYRYQSDEKRVNFRIGFVPIFYDEGIIWAGGVSIGYTFKAD